MGRIHPSDLRIEHKISEGVKPKSYLQCDCVIKNHHLHMKIVNVRDVLVRVTFCFLPSIATLPH